MKVVVLRDDGTVAFTWPIKPGWEVSLDHRNYFTGKNRDVIVGTRILLQGHRPKKGGKK